MRVLFIAPYPAGESPSQRYRLEHYLPLLAAGGIQYDYKTFIGIDTWRIIFQPGNYLQKVSGIAWGFCKRLFLLFFLWRYDFIYIHREATPIGPAFFEWTAAKLYRKKIIYDFDDAIWIPFTSSNNKAASRLKHFGKVAKICDWAYKISVGNEFLADFARKYNDKVIVIPTVVNTENVHNKLQNQETFTPAIGWSGTFSTLKYLEIITPVLIALQENYDFTFIVIADKNPELPLKKYQFIKWSREKEAVDLLSFHIGVMPLYDDELSKGKCGFKAIQYMAMGIPAVVSPVGVNATIIDEGENGYLCTHENEWEEKLSRLLDNMELRKAMGMAARKKIEKQYSVKTTSQLFINLFG